MTDGPESASLARSGRAKPLYRRRCLPILSAAACWLAFGAAGAAKSAPVAAAVQPDVATVVDAAVASGDRDRLARAARWFSPWRQRARSPRLAAAAVRLATVCRERRACDGYHALRYARRATDPSASDIRMPLAREFLGIDLPWYALELLGDRRAGPPTVAETSLRRRAQDAGAVIVQDSGAVMPRPAIQGVRGRVAERLWHIFGMPANEVAGSYLDAGFYFAPRVHALSDWEFMTEYRISRGDWIRSHGVRPMLTALLSRAPRPDLERIYELDAPATITGVPLTITPSQLAWLVNASGAASGNAAVAARAQLTSILAATRLASTGPVPGEFGFDDVETPVFASASSRDGTWLLSTGAGQWSGGEHVAIVQRAGRLVGYALGTANSAWLEDIDGEPGPEVVLTSVEGSSSYLDASIFSPPAATMSRVANTLYRGQLAFVDLDGDPAKEIVVSKALSIDVRYSDCNQCPKRRSAYILDFDRQSRRYRAAGASFTGTEDASNAARHLFGMTATMLAGLSAGEAEGALRRLAGGEPLMQDDVSAALRQAVAYIEAGNFPEALRYSGAAATRLEPLSRSPEGAAYIDAQTMAGYAEVQSGNPLAAIARLRRIPADIVGQRRASAQSYWSLMAVAAMTLGDATVAYEAMQREQAIAAADNRSPGQGNLTWLFSHFGAWRTAREQVTIAIDTSLQEGNSDGLALMMIAAADAERRRGDMGSALDWLARGLRRTRSSADSGGSALAIQVAVAIALDAGLPEMAIALLDVSLLSHNAATWPVRGPDHLLLYGRALEQQNRPDQASMMFAAAARLAERRSGLVSVEAWAEVGRIALLRSDQAGAREAYRRAFTRIADGRRTTPTDGYKINFLQNVDAIAERHFALSSGSAPSEIRQLASDLEAWKFQVFRDRYSAQTSVQPDIISSVQGRLQPNEAYVSYFISNSISFAIIVTRDGVRRRDLSLMSRRARQLRSEILAFMDLGNPTSAAYIRERRMPRPLHLLLQQARAELIEPLGLGSDIDTLLINEDEDVAGLPWAAVPAVNDSWLDSIRWALGFPRVRSLLERYRLAVVPSAQMVIRESAAHNPTQRVVVAAALGAVESATVSRALGVASREDRYGSLPPLRQGAPEVDAVRGAFNVPPVLLLDPFAARLVRGPARPLGREQLRSALAGATVWHFVGHGIFNRVDPMGSTIFLGGGGGGDPQWVSASELSEWDLSRVTFVALSACETGTTRPEVGAETFGMLRGLLGAGVHTAMVMAWPVDDLATSRFYQSFYNRFGSESRGDAHRRAALDVKDTFVHPFYWSAASLYGDWR